MITRMTDEELAAAREWLAARLAREAEPPFSFACRGRHSRELLPGWRRESSSRRLDGVRTEQTITYADAGTGLSVRCVAVSYADFPVVEWTVSLRNTGSADTPVLSDIQGLDWWFERSDGGEFVLHHQRGDFCTADSYQPFEQLLYPNSIVGFAPVGGRGTNSAFPYYNLQMPGGGLIFGVGWPGQWATRFERDGGRLLRVRAGQELTHLVLRPGEEVRTPLIVLLFWRGPDRQRSQNLWRRWMLAHNTPRVNGAPPRPLLSFCDGGFFPGLKISEAGEVQFMDVLARERIRLDYWWVDAGWYPCDSWPTIGTWVPDPERFPNGLKAVSDHAHRHGAGFIVWFEPERVSPGSWLYREHPSWLLGRDGETKLLDLGNPAALAWLVDHVDRLIREQGIDLYRQDFNIDPLAFWRGNDAEDRQGISENRHVQGYLAYWDELQRRHPGMLIDSCASGGRRNDLETLRRAVPLLRSDYQSFQGDPATAPGNQCHTFALSTWIPFHGHGVYYSAHQLAYSARSYLCPAFALVADVRTGGIDWDLYRRLIEEWRQVSGCYHGDYYPLASYTLADDAWLAWQFDLPEEGRGFIQAFRRAASPAASMTLALRGLEQDARYEVTDLDTGRSQTLAGGDLMAAGIPVSLPEPASAAILTYRRASP